jgi:hypothetical protein
MIQRILTDVGLCYLAGGLALFAVLCYRQVKSGVWWREWHNSNLHWSIKAPCLLLALLVVMMPALLLWPLAFIKHKEEE